MLIVTIQPQGEADSEGSGRTGGVHVVILFSSVCGPTVDGIGLAALKGKTLRFC